ncbi:MAG: hypothetical protein ACRDKX_05800 [Solirubrobacterales bacterium]
MLTSKPPAVATVTVQARACLAGENLDWMGLPTVAVALDRLSLSGTARAEVGRDLRFVSRSADGGLLGDFSPASAPDSSGDFERACSGALDVLRASGALVPDRLAIELQSNIPIGVGLASSGALHLGLAGLLSAASENSDPRPETLAERAYLAEHDRQGVMCGRMDQYASALGGLQRQSHPQDGPPEIEQLEVDGSDRYVIGWTLLGTSFAFEVGPWLRDCFARGEPGVRAYGQSTRRLVDQLAAILREPASSARRFAAGEILDAAQHVTGALLGEQDGRITAALVAARRAGAAGAKGLGVRARGGAMLALTDAERAPVVAAAVSASGLQVAECVARREGIRVTRGTT